MPGFYFAAFVSFLWSHPLAEMFPQKSVYVLPGLAGPCVLAASGICLLTYRLALSLQSAVLGGLTMMLIGLNVVWFGIVRNWLFMMNVRGSIGWNFF